MVETRRVLITGVSRFWGGHLAKLLEASPSIERIVAVDTKSPTVNLERTDFVRADIRHSLIGKLLHALDIDTVVHAGLIVDPRRAGSRAVHETNVIGTMNLLAACGGAASPVRKLVVKSSTAVYGCESNDPSLWSETMVRRSPARDNFTRDLDEVEAYVHDFRLRKPDAVVTLLRFANVLGSRHDTPFARLFDLRLVPTVLGFDPRLQFLHEDDAVHVLEQAVLRDEHGTFNVAGDGVVLLSQAIALLGKMNAPVIPFIGQGLAMAIFNRALPVGFPPHLARLLQFGRVVDTSMLRERFGPPTHSTVDTVREHGKNRRVQAILEDRPYTYETELEDFLRSRRLESNGHHAGRRATRTRRRDTPATRRDS